MSRPLRKIPKSLESLAMDAKKYDKFEDFLRAYAVEGMHGRYWHITKDSNFSIKEVSPRDLSTLAFGDDSYIGLMVTANPRHWRDIFKERKYVAEIDLSGAIPDKDYNIVNRGFGNEVFITNLKAVKVKKVYPIKEGMKEYSRYFYYIGKKFTEPEELMEFYKQATERRSRPLPSYKMRRDTKLPKSVRYV